MEAAWPSDFGGLTPLICSIPSTVTVFPAGVLSVVFSFFLPMIGRLEQALIRKSAPTIRINTLNKGLLLWIMKIFPFIVS